MAYNFAEGHYSQDHYQQNNTMYLNQIPEPIEEFGEGHHVNFEDRTLILVLDNIDTSLSPSWDVILTLSYYRQLHGSERL